jgi:hypothetical protein
VTLIELLVTMLIFSTFSLVFFAFVSWNLNASYKGVEKHNQQKQFRTLNAQLVEDLLHARDIKIENHPTSHILSYTSIEGKVMVLSFEENGLYRLIDEQKVEVALGRTFDQSLPGAVFVDGNGMIKINFYANEINSLMFFGIKPRVFNAS